MVHNLADGVALADSIAVRIWVHFLQVHGSRFTPTHDTKARENCTESRLQIEENQ